MAFVTNKDTGEQAWYDEGTGKLNHIITNQKTGQRALWDGQNMTPISPEIAKHLDAMNGPKTAEPDLMQKGKEMAVQDASNVNKSFSRNLGAPLAQAGLAYATAGQSLPIQAGIGGGAEFLLQKAGINPKDPAQVGLQASIPYVGPLVTKVGNMMEGGLVGLGRLAANLSGQGPKAADQAVADVLGVPTNKIQRSTYAPSAAKYTAAERQGPLSTRAAYQGIDDVINEEKALGSQANQSLITKLEGIKTDLSSGTEDAAVLVKKSQRLMKDAEGFDRRRPAIARAMRDAAEAIKAGVPGQKAADVVYTRETAIDDIFTAMGKSNKLSAVDDLIQKQGTKLRSVISDKDLEDIRMIASQVENMSGGPDAGVFKTLYNSTIKSFLANPNSLTVFRKAFGPNLERITPQGIAGLMTFMRAYNAYEENPPQKTEEKPQEATPLIGSYVSPYNQQKRQ